MRLGVVPWRCRVVEGGWRGRKFLQWLINGHTAACQGCKPSLYPLGGGQNCCFIGYRHSVCGPCFVGKLVQRRTSVQSLPFLSKLPSGGCVLRAVTLNSTRFNHRWRCQWNLKNGTSVAGSTRLYNCFLLGQEKEIEDTLLGHPIPDMMSPGQDLYTVVPLAFLAFGPSTLLHGRPSFLCPGH